MEPRVILKMQFLDEMRKSGAGAQVRLGCFSLLAVCMFVSLVLPLVPVAFGFCYPLSLVRLKNANSLGNLSQIQPPFFNSVEGSKFWHSLKYRPPKRMQLKFKSKSLYVCYSLILRDVFHPEESMGRKNGLCCLVWELLFWKCGGVCWGV